MTEQARVVVIGGGIMGASVLYGLARNGWTDALLLEKAELTSGSTWHAAGQIAHAVGSRVMGWINRASIETYHLAQAETGVDIGWHGCGGVRVAYDEAEEDWLRSIMTVGRLLDFPMELVGPERIAEVNPFYDVSGIRAGVLTFEDGHVDPSGATHAVAAAARRLGARIRTRTRVTGVERAGDEWRVLTGDGVVRAEHVVIAAGSYANQVGEWFGLQVPSVSCLHHYFVTEPVPAFIERDTELPVMRDNSYGGYIRQEQRSGLIGVYEKSDAPAVWEDGAPWDAEHELFEADYDAIGPLLERAFERMPVLADLGIRTVVRGAITHTPDGGMLVGPAPRHPNLWLACGASIGLAWGGGAGKALADLMVFGETGISMRHADPRRFGDFATRDWISARSREDFEVRHDTPVPGLQRRAGRPWRRSPLYDRLRERGAVFGEVAGFERPRWFADRPGEADSNGWRRQPWHDAVARECEAVRSAAGVIDLGAFAKFMVRGRDAYALLDRLSANRVPTEDGRVVLAHLLTPSGHFETEVTITRLDAARFYLGSAVAGHHKDRDWLLAHRRPGEDVEVDDLTHDWGMLAVSGPTARALLLAGVPAVENLAWLRGCEGSIFGAHGIALRVSFTGECGYELHVPANHVADVYDALHAAGAEHGLRDFGSHALNSLRMEKAYRASAELTPDVGLVEADMARFFRPANRDFNGRTATLERLADGADWRLVYLEVDAAGADCHGGESIECGGRVIGMTTSGGYGHWSGRSLAFGYVRAAEPIEAPLGVRILDEVRAARILDEPVHDPDNERLRA